MSDNHYHYHVGGLGPNKNGDVLSKAVLDDLMKKFQAQTASGGFAAPPPHPNWRPPPTPKPSIKQLNAVPPDDDPGEPKLLEQLRTELLTEIYATFEDTPNTECLGLLNRRFSGKQILHALYGKEFTITPVDDTGS